METNVLNNMESEWRWCLVGNIVVSHEFGEEHELRNGTKQFPPGAKVYLAPVQWGDGYERIVVIGNPRKTSRYIQIIMQSKYIENMRLQKVFKPAVLKSMEESEYYWWSNTDKDRDEIIKYLDTRNPAEAEKARQKRDEKNAKYAIVKKYIDEYDYYGLLGAGAPSDEFDAESEMISSHIGREDSVEDIASTICEVMSKSFRNEKDKPEYFMEIAEKN